MRTLPWLGIERRFQSRSLSPSFAVPFHPLLSRDGGEAAAALSNPLLCLGVRRSTSLAFVQVAHMTQQNLSRTKPERTDQFWCSLNTICASIVDYSGTVLFISAHSWRDMNFRLKKWAALQTRRTTSYGIFPHSFQRIYHILPFLRYLKQD